MSTEPIVDPSELDGVAASLERDGVAVIPGVLSPAVAADGLERLWAATRESERRGVPAHIAGLDPNASNVRVFNLIDLDPLFGALIAHPVADDAVTAVLGREYIVSNFTANIARPGSASMVVHSDQAAVMPEPWVVPQTVNIIWCLTDVHADNGATLHIPGSHRYRTLADVPDDPIAHMVPFEAAAGSVIVMEGRVWHTSGRNVTEADDRALLFGYYTKPFIRPQWNFTRSLAPDVQASCSPLLRYRLGLDTTLNMPSEDIFGDLVGRR
ncbi:MAG: phytanoyl-CoA dioxygenase family protein [Ilumatobacteraceae bacterium]